MRKAAKLRELFSQKLHDSRVHFRRPLQMHKVAGAGNDNFLKARREVTIHAFESRHTAGPVFRSVKSQRRHRDRCVGDLSLQRGQSRVPVRGVKRVPIIVERCGQYAGLTKS